MTVSIHIVQYNVNRQKIASLQLRHYCDEIKADLVLIQEPVVSNSAAYAFERCRQAAGGTNPGAIVVILNPELRVIELTDLSSQHVVAIKIYRGGQTDDITVVSAYFKYNMPTHIFIEKLRPILDREPRTVIGADVNGHSRLWHCPNSNSRGLMVEELVEDFDLTVANMPGHIPTYDHEGMGTSNIDVC